MGHACTYSLLQAGFQLEGQNVMLLFACEAGLRDMANQRLDTRLNGYAWSIRCTTFVANVAEKKAGESKRKVLARSCVDVFLNLACREPIPTGSGQASAHLGSDITGSAAAVGDAIGLFAEQHAGEAQQRDCGQAEDNPQEARGTPPKAHRVFPRPGRAGAL